MLDFLKRVFMPQKALREFRSTLRVGDVVGVPYGKKVINRAILGLAMEAKTSGKTVRIIHKVKVLSESENGTITIETDKLLFPRR